MLLRNLMGQQSETLELDALPDDNFQSWVDVSDTYRVGWRVMEDRVRFRVYSSLGGWLGLGVSHEGFMVKPPSVAVVGHSPNTAKVVAQLVLRDMALSAFTPLGSPSLLPGARVASSEGRTVLTFERLIKAADPEDLSLDVIGGDTTFIFAHGESSTPSYHGNTRGNFKANLATGCLSSITAGGADLGKTRTLHGMTMFIGWSTLVSLGIMVARCEYAAFPPLAVVPTMSVQMRGSMSGGLWCTSGCSSLALRERCRACWWRFQWCRTNWHRPMPSLA